MSLLKIFLVLASFLSLSLNAKTRSELPAPLPITTQDIQFDLIPNEPGPEWSCTHKEVPNLPYDWRVHCQSLNSGARADFFVHFLIRINGPSNQFLEVLYWVDEVMTINNKAVTLSHGQTTLLTTGQTINQINFRLGQLVQNGTSSLNIFLNTEKKKRL